MSKSIEIYEKTLDYYNSGNIEKALEVCSRGGEEVLDDSSLLNLKGLLYYIKGDMNGARRIWNLNYTRNHDEVSKKYLLSSKDDEEMWKLYIKALKYANELNISEAIESLEECIRTSDFNKINVNNELCKCYMKKGEYVKAISAMEKVLDIDRYNKVAKQKKKELQDLGVLKKEKGKTIFVSTSIILVLLICIFSGTKFYNYKKPNDVLNGVAKIRNKDNKAKKDENHIIENKKQEVEEKRKVEEQKKLESKKKEEQLKNIEEEKKKKKEIEQEIKNFPRNEVKSYLSKKDFIKLDKIMTKWGNKELDLNDKVILNETKNFMDRGAGQYFYNLGRNNSKLGKFKEAIEYYDIGIKYGKGVFPYEDGLYMLGVCYNKIGNIEKAIGIYERYYKEYTDKSFIKQGNYIKDVLIYLTNTYRKLNDNKYKVYEIALKKLN
ncbi:tetratricopeptide repeat protein [Hathewaya limosa]|uniref:Tetratricopeptide (TPR) repeat protein n=1 Tax=Hathewaya limosa TaxID=1536 RepID=A0ABU0JSL8_HATLI|nr:tetratricopeptide repeat protein [Hathewaya limosa]MDQ0480044.1 tetratricopeptide (TPR) repeat protein [Hathewaya limosa]